MLDNIFEPIFKATLYPEQHPEIYRFLLTMTGFDCVDDESEYEILTLQQLMMPPCEWKFDYNPPYVYYLYYLYANIQNLNVLRASLKLNTF
jgi:AMP deaminase